MSGFLRGALRLCLSPLFLVSLSARQGMYGLPYLAFLPYSRERVVWSLPSFLPISLNVNPCPRRLNRSSRSSNPKWLYAFILCPPLNRLFYRFLVHFV